MIQPDAVYKHRWRQRILRTRRRYFFERWKASQEKRPSLSQLWRWMKNDFVFIFKWIKNIILQIRMYGKVIRENHKTSYPRQFWQLMYLRFVIREHPIQYRKRQLFKPKNWQFADQYEYGQVMTQLDLAKASYPEEIDIIEDKFEFYSFCSQMKIKTPTVFSVFNNGKAVYLPREEFKLPRRDLFIKEQKGGKGAGVRKLTYSEGVYSDKNQTKFSAEDVHEYLLQSSQSNSDLIVQEVLKNHSAWQVFTPGSLATCRIVTARYPEENSIIPIFATFRMPVGNADNDNYSTGGLASSVNLENGILGRAVTVEPVNGQFEWTVHPDTKQQIEGTKLPFWNDILAFALDVHGYFKTLVVGWDVSMTTDGCYMIEGNITWSAGLFENTNQIPLSRTIYPELYEKWMEKYTQTA